MSTNELVVGVEISLRAVLVRRAAKPPALGAVKDEVTCSALIVAMYTVRAFQIQSRSLATPRVVNAIPRITARTT